MSNFWVFIVVLVFFLSPILFVVLSISRITDDELEEWHKGLERQVRRDMGIKNFGKEEDLSYGT